jgi:hypothetical protein
MDSVSEFAVGRAVRCRGALCGTVTFVVWDPGSDLMTGLVVQPEGGAPARLVPADRVSPSLDGIEFEGTLAEFDALEEARDEAFLQNTERAWDDRGDHVLVVAPEEP